MRRQHLRYLDVIPNKAADTTLEIITQIDLQTQCAKQTCTKTAFYQEQSGKGTLSQTK